LQNCTQLGGFYLGEGQVLCARYMLGAAWALLERTRAKPGAATVTEEVAANVSLGLGKFHMDLLAESAAEFQRQGGAAAAGRCRRDGKAQELAELIPGHLRC
jgi:hypothetical protein